MRVYLFACIEKNIGDDLFIKVICERYPNIIFVIAEQAKYGSLKKIPNLHFSKKLAKWIWATSLLPRNPVKKAIATVLRVFYRIGLPRYDVAIDIVGNAFKNINYMGWEQSYWIRARVKLAKRFYLLSTNFGPYNDERWKADFEKIFPQMADVCFRDKYSHALFGHLPNTRLAPDAVISMGKQDTSEKKPYANKVVIISLIDCAFTARSKSLHKVANTFESKIVDIANTFLKKGYTVTLLNSNAEQDRPACDRILNKLNSANVDSFDYDGNLEDVFDLYRNSSVVIATRLHTIVLAWLYRIPVVPIVYDIKVENMLNTYNFTCDRYNIEKLDTISGEDIYNSFCKYNFVLSNDIIKYAESQFQETDKEFKKRDLT